jgi:hypothetical protein
MQTAFPPSDYYEASAPPEGHQPTTSLPATAPAGQQGGRPRVVPTFTTDRSTREMPSYTPTASPRVRRSLSSWPPHRFVHPGSGVARHLHTADAHGTPTQIHQVRVGSTLTGLHALVPLVHLLVSLAGPAPSGSADAPRRCQDCFPPSPASPGSGCPQLQPGCCDSPAARASHPCSVTREVDTGRPAGIATGGFPRVASRTRRAPHSAPGSPQASWVTCLISCGARP